jgi:hypothetical protein
MNDCGPNVDRPRSGAHVFHDQYGEADCVFKTFRGLTIAEVKATSTYTKEHSGS